LTNAVSCSEVTWEAILEIVETKKDFLFYLSKQSACLVPKEALFSLDEIRKLRRIVLASAGDRVKLQASSDLESGSM
jgi:hypothetical protein